MLINFKARITTLCLERDVKLGGALVVKYAQRRPHSLVDFNLLRSLCPKSLQVRYLSPSPRELSSSSFAFNSAFGS